MFRRIPFIGGGGYSGKVLGTATANLIGYWPLWETAGAVADNLEGTAARDGAYTTVTLNSSTGPDGRPVGLWDGTNDYCHVYSDSFRDAFNGSEGTIALWAKVSGAGVWTDSTERKLFMFRVDANNSIYARRNTADGRIDYYYVSGGTTQTRVKTAISATGWMHFGLTWSKAGDAVKAYYNGVQEGATLTGLGIWAGVVVPAQTILGALITTPNHVWDGYLAHAAVWTTPLTVAQILALATV